MDAANKHKRNARPGVKIEQVTIEKEAFGSPMTTVANFTLPSEN